MFSPIKNLYIEINGVKVGSISSYNVKSICSSRHLDTLWGNGSADTAKGNTKYIVSLTKICLANSIINFYTLSNFTLKIFKPIETITFSSCEWTEMEESGSLERIVIEKFNIISLKRTEN